MPTRREVLAAGCGPAERRDPILHVPPGLPAGRPAPLVVALHGAGGDAEAGVGLLQPAADERGLVVLAPASHGDTPRTATPGTPSSATSGPTRP